MITPHNLNNFVKNVLLQLEDFEVGNIEFDIKIKESECDYDSHNITFTVARDKNNTF